MKINFVKKVSNYFNYDDCIYIDNKYFHDVDFIIPQKEIVKPFENCTNEAIVNVLNDISDVNLNLVANAG